MLHVIPYPTQSVHSAECPGSSAGRKWAPCSEALPSPHWPSLKSNLSKAAPMSGLSRIIALDNT